MRESLKNKLLIHCTPQEVQELINEISNNAIMQIEKIVTERISNQAFTDKAYITKHALTSLGYVGRRTRLNNLIAKGIIKTASDGRICVNSVTEYLQGVQGQPLPEQPEKPTKQKGFIKGCKYVAPKFILLCCEDKEPLKMTYNQYMRTKKYFPENHTIKQL